jgi:proton-coupled amino acid transporter
MIPVGAMMGYSLQLYIAIQVIYPHLKASLSFCQNHPLQGELIFRIFMTFVTFLIAMSVPNLGLLISMIGAICSPSLAFVFPVIMNISLRSVDSTLTKREIFKSFSILSLALVGVLSGAYESINEIKKLYQ